MDEIKKVKYYTPNKNKNLLITKINLKSAFNRFNRILIKKLAQNVYTLN